MQTSPNIYLFMASFNSKYAIYIVETEAIKASDSRLQNTAEAAPSVKNKKPITLIHCE
jgi:hypothetical protein